MIGMFVVISMIRDPTKSGIFKSAGPKNQGGKSHRPFGLEGEMREEPVIAQRDAEAGRDDVKQHQPTGKPIHPVFDEIDRSGNDGQCGNDKKENGIDPVYTLKRDAG